MENLEIYEKGREVPPEALKPITAGRLKGMSDINPMWRIKKLTEIFGPCGIGWWYKITDKRIEKCDNGEACAFVDIELFYKHNGEVSQPVQGTGGSMLAARESKGIHISDECFKMALTDAISVAAKALGIGADIYYAADPDTKYRDRLQTPNNAPNNAPPIPACATCGNPIKGAIKNDGATTTAQEIADRTTAKYGQPLCTSCARQVENARQNN